MNERFLQLTHREIPAYFGNRRLLLAFAVVTGIFALTGPFGTYDGFSFPGRILYWFVMQAACWSVALITIIVVGAVFGRSPQGDWAITIAGAALAGLPIAVIIMASKNLLNGTPFTVAGYGEEAVLAVPISVMLGLLASLAMRGGASPATVAEPGKSDDVIALLDRLPPEKRGSLHYLSMQDHYVEVVTSNGTELILLRFADALREVPEDLGLRIHRSHWVARDAVTGWRRENGKLLLALPDGSELPVSRSYLNAARAAGFGQGVAHGTAG